MPIYEFKCRKCGEVLEKLMRVSDPAPTKCQNCQEHNALVKIMSSTGFILKGTGWYETDFKK